MKKFMLIILVLGLLLGGCKNHVHGSNQITGRHQFLCDL